MSEDRLIDNLKGIGPKTAELYHKLGIFSCEDLICYFPRDYICFEAIIDADDSHIGSLCAISGILAARPLMRKKGRLSVTSAVIRLENGVMSAVWFNMPYLYKSLKAGERYIFRGILSHKGDKYHMEHPAIYDELKYSKLLDSLQPVYPLTKGLSNGNITRSVKKLLDPDEYDGIKLKSVLNGESDKIRAAIREIHFPKDLSSLKKARSLLVYDEFFLFILKLRLLKGHNTALKNSFKIYPSGQTKLLIESLPYKLTDAQLKVWHEIEEDLTKDTSMSRLIQGDVGSGKTIIAVLAAVMTGMSGYQTALMAPTEILATQHFMSISELFKKFDIPLRCVLLTGSMTASKKKEARDVIASGEADIIIGTHALIQEKVEYRTLALVITDEQHRFGVRQRETLTEKNNLDDPHVLVMSATPIPRTLAIIIYGDLDISVIDEVPKRRLPIKNCVVERDYRKKAYEFILKEIRAGHQAYIICPLVEGSEGLDAEDVVSYTEKIRGSFPGDIVISYLHGKMKPIDKNKVMSSFADGNIDILVSTTVVEVGVNVPNATVMLIENAERFGLAQLHQLRGRIGRGDKQSYCIFMSGNPNKETIKRLEILNKSNDGFYIASEDMRLRGPGDLFGIRQSGDMIFRLGDIVRDSDILMAASGDVNKLLTDDPDISKPEHAQIRRLIESNDIIGENVTL